MYIAFCSAKWIILRHDNTCTLWRMQMISDQYQSMFSGKGKYILDVSGIIEKFNVYATLAIMPRTKGINKAFWFHFYTIFARRIWLFYYFTIIPETSILKLCNFFFTPNSILQIIVAIDVSGINVIW